MIGAIIGELAVWTWEHDRETFYHHLMNNSDDHNKNFSFTMNRKGEWRLSPAYDMTYIIDDVPYMNYVKAVKNNPIARAVKMADLLHNMDTSRLKEITDCDKQRLEKYQKAFELLQEDLKM